MKGFNGVLLESGNFGTAFAPIGILLGFALLLLGYVGWRFRFDTDKAGVLPGI